MTRGPTSFPTRAEAVLARLPSGTLELANHYLARGSQRLANQEDGREVEHDPATVASHLVRPVLLSNEWPDPTDPLPVGDGAVHADLIDDDLDALARLRSTFDKRPDPERLAAEAQAWRLPVTPYRLPRSASPTLPSPADVEERANGSARRGRPNRPLSRCLVVDLSALWAGPLATKLLADQGVTVTKIDPGCRPDAFAAHPRLYQHLNGGKDIIDLDLRESAARSRFEKLLTEADLLVDSFSRRVLPNLGYGLDEIRRINPRLATLSIVAFPKHSPEADWLSYGPGVHATSGLAADTSAERTVYRSAPIAYPDALTGLRAFGIAIDALTSPGGSHHEVSLASSIDPLLRRVDEEGTVIEQ